MQPPSHDSSRWTGEINPYPQAGRGWRPVLGQAYVPPHLEGATPASLADQQRAIGHAFLLMLSTILLWIAGALVGAASSDLLVAPAPILSFWPVPFVCGFALSLLAARANAAAMCRWVAFAGWIAVAVAAFTYSAAAIYARGHVAPGPQMRGQIATIKAGGGRYSKTKITALALADGTFVATDDYPAGEYGSLGRCLEVRRLTGPFGFTWLSISAAAPLPPAPGPGQLTWGVEPVDRSDCFSGKPLSQLVPRT